MILFDNKVGTTMKSALYLSYRHIGWTVALLFTHIAAFILVLLYWIVIGWFIFGLAAFINTRLFDGVFKGYYDTGEREE